MAGNFDPLRRQWTLRGTPLAPRVWMADENRRPEAFNCQVIALDCSLRSSLRWEKQASIAKRCRNENIAIAWDLTSAIPAHPLGSQHRGSVSATLRALEQFSQTLYAEFSDLTLFAILAADTIAAIAQEERFGPTAHERWQERCDVWRTLATALPENCPTGILIDVADSAPEIQLRALAPNRLAHLLPFINGQLRGLGALMWRRDELIATSEGSAAPLEEAMAGLGISRAILVPHWRAKGQETWPRLGQLAKRLDERQIAYRVIALNCLRDHWEGLDEVIVDAVDLSTSDQRLLAGFSAAGGRMIPLRSLDTSADFAAWCSGNVDTAQVVR